MLMSDLILDGGLVDIILTSLGLSSDVVIIDDYTFFYSLFAIVLALVFVIYIIVMIFRCVSSIFKSCRL